MTKNSRISFAFAVILLMAAAGLRLVNLASLPLGLHQQEIVDLRLAENVRQGDVQVFFDVGDEGREGLYPMIVAALTGIFGRGVLIYHVISVWAGMITLALVYALTRRLYGDLAGLAALALLSFNFLALLLSRTVGRETLLPLLTSAVLLSLALGLPIYWRRRGARTLTTAFGALGTFVGLSFYVHPAALLIALVPLLVIGYLLLARQRLTGQTISHIIYTALLVLIVATPYLTSAVRLPELSGVTRLIRGGVVSTQAPLERIANGVLALGVRGDPDPILNLPGRPLFDPISALLIGVGLYTALRYARKPRYGMVVIAAAALLPLALLAPKSPQFPAFAAVLPVLALLFGLGVAATARALLPYGVRRAQIYALLGALSLFNLGWTGYTLLIAWPARAEVKAAYQAPLGALALHIDRTAARIPTVICDEERSRQGPTPSLSRSQLIALMMNFRGAPVRHVDCNYSMVMANGGERQQLVLADPAMLEAMHPLIRAWLRDAQPVPLRDAAADSLIELRVTEDLADTVGRFTTTAPVAYPPEVAMGQREGFAPPVRFGNNLTFLGYETLPTEYQAGESVTVVTYWRVDGPLPADLELFTHVQDDPGARPVGNRSGDIGVVPAELQTRDIFMQITTVPLPIALPPRRYLVSVGAYRERSINQERLNIFDAQNRPRGDRLILYWIDVVENRAQAGATAREGQ